MTDRNIIRQRIHTRIRRKVSGTAERPRLAVHRSLNHIYAQVIDDATGRTLASASTLEMKTGGHDAAAASAVGKAIAQKAAAAGVKSVVLDRGGFL